MKAIAVAVCLGTVLFLVATGKAQPSKAASVAVTAAHSLVRTGEDVYVHVTLTNNSKQAVVIEFRSPLCDYTVEVRDSAGNLAPDTDSKSKSDCSHPHPSGADGFVRLKPNESTTGTISVSMFSDLSRTGEYSVQVGWREPKELGGVVVKSNTVKVTVAP